LTRSAAHTIVASRTDSALALLAETGRHHVDLAKVQTQQENRLWPFFSALESFFFAGLSEWNLKKIWKIQKNYSHTNSEWF